MTDIAEQQTQQMMKLRQIMLADLSSKQLLKPRRVMRPDMWSKRAYEAAVRQEEGEHTAPTEQFFRKRGAAGEGRNFRRGTNKRVGEGESLVRLMIIGRAHVRPPGTC